jgi:hypothetical protein
MVGNMSNNIDIVARSKANKNSATISELNAQKVTKNPSKNL